MRALLLLLIVATACGDSTHVAVDGAADAPADVEIFPDEHLPSWTAPVTLSDPTATSVVPAIAVLGSTVVVAWHDFPGGGSTSRVAMRVIASGVLGPITAVPETLPNGKRPALATTATGFVLAWDAVENGKSVVRTIDLDGAGVPIGAPVTISASGATGVNVRVAARGDDVVWAWTDGSAHYFARRGSVETRAATPVGTTLQAGGILNFPRVAITSGGAILLAYRDGGTQANDWDVLLEIEQPGGAFQGPLNVSRSAGLLSDDISLAIRADDTLDVVWVDQDPNNVNAFEVTHATRTPGGLITQPEQLAKQGTFAWTPSTVPGPVAAWHTGMGAGGDLWLSAGAGAPQQILPGEQGGAVALARSAAGLHLVYVTPTAPRQVRYTTL